MRLFLDANVLFTAAHNPSGKAALMTELGKVGLWALTTSRYASEEARRNLERKLPRSRDDPSSLLRGIRLVEHRPELRFPAGLVEKDRPIFQAAVACGATHLLTGDRKDFGPFMNRPEETFGIVVQTVADFLQSTLEQAGPTRRRTARRGSVPQPPSRGMSNTGWPPMPAEVRPICNERSARSVHASQPRVSMLFPDPTATGSAHADRNRRIENVQSIESNNFS